MDLLLLAGKEKSMQQLVPYETEESMDQLVLEGTDKSMGHQRLKGRQIYEPDDA